MDSRHRGETGALLPGDPARVGPYEITGRLGEGGMGAVYLGRGPDGRRVAVKVVRPELARDPGFVARFQDEVANAQRVASFCTAQVLDHGEVGGRAYMVTEFIDGASLLEYVRENGALDPGMLHGVAVGVAAALVAIHSAGLIHRDLKPANVLLSLSGPRVIDFGIARALDTVSAHTLTGQLIGSPGWMAPEQIRVERITTAADIFAWGCLVGYAGNGTHPYGHGDFSLLAYRITMGEVDPLAIPSLPAPLSHLVAAALNVDPARRPTARDLLLALVGGDGENAVLGTLNRSWTTPPNQEPAAAAIVPATEPYASPPTAWNAQPAGAASDPATVPGGGAAGGYAAAPENEPRTSLDDPRQEHPAQPWARPPTTRPGHRRRSAGPRRGVLAAVLGGVALVAAAAVAAVVIVLDSGGSGSTSGSTKTATSAGLVGGPAATGALFVRLDPPGKPGECTSQIARTDPKADNPKPLDPPGGSCDVLPQFSPDHRLIAFTRNNGASGHPELWVMWPDGTHAKMVTDKIKEGTRAAWSPDGKRLAFTYDASPTQIYIITPWQATAQQITTDPKGASGVSWSRDSKHLAFTSTKSGKPQIYTLDLDDASRWTQLTYAPDRATNAAWSRDGSKIAFTYGPAGQAQIYLMDADGKNQHPVTSGNNDQDPCWNPAGDQIGFARGPGVGPQVYAVSTGGGTPTQITRGTRTEGHPSW